MNLSDLKLEILERLAQVVGHFYKYDETSDANILIKEGVFLCIDKVKRPQGKPGCDWYFIIHVVDAAQKLSYNRSEIRTDASIQMMAQD